jgi:hypothetical protein
MIYFNSRGDSPREVVVDLESCGGGTTRMAVTALMKCGEVGDLDTKGSWPGYRCRFCGALSGSMAECKEPPQ